MVVQAHKFNPKATSERIDFEDPIKFLEEKFDRGVISGKSDLQDYGVYRLLGWEYDFRPWMRKFVVKQYGQWFECWAPNKTLLRRSTYGRIQKILELH